MRTKIHSYLGFSKRSRQLLSGYNACIAGMEKGKVRLLILAGDLAENTKKKCSSAAARLGVPLRTYGTVEELSDMAGEADRGVYGITDRNLARAILEEIDRPVAQPPVREKE